MDQLGTAHRLSSAGLRRQADAYRDQVRRRIAKEQGGSKRNREAVLNAAYEEMWEVFKPAVEKYEEDKQAKQDKQNEQPENETPQLQGMPDRTTDDILDPKYAEKDPGKQLRDGLLWAALEFDRVIEDTDNGPVAHLNDASSPPPNAFAVGTLRTYALSPTEKRRDLIGRALAFAAKTHDQPIPDSTDEGAFLHELL